MGEARSGCPQCGSDEISARRDVLNDDYDEVSIVWCGECGLVRRDIEGDRAEYHAGENPVTYDDVWARAKETDLMLPGYEGTWLDRFNFALGDFDGVGVVCRPRVLEVGCGIGHNLAAFRRFGCDVAGVEPSGPAARFARERYGLDVTEAYLEEADFDPGSFDLVIVDSVLEHLPDPIGALKHVATLLAPEGRVYVDVPNLDAWEGKFLGRKWAIYEAGHINFFTPATLGVLLEAGGFEVLRVATYEGLVTWGPVLEEKAKRWVRPLVRRTAQGKVAGAVSGAGSDEVSGAGAGKIRPGLRRYVENGCWLALGALLTPLRRAQMKRGGGQNIWALATPVKTGGHS